MTQGESSQSEQKRKSPSARTLAEIEAGKKAVILYGKFQKVDEATESLNKAFPNLQIGAVLNSPYTHVTIRARMLKLAPLDSPAVLMDDCNDVMNAQEIEFTDPLDSYPTDHLVAQLALIS